MDFNKYDAIFLDLCGPMTSHKFDCFKTIKSGTKLAITLLMARESKILQNYIDINNREKSYIKFFSDFNINIEYYINYSDKPQSPMCVFFGEKQF